MDKVSEFLFSHLEYVVLDDYILLIVPDNQIFLYNSIGVLSLALKFFRAKEELRFFSIYVISYTDYKNMTYNNNYIIDGVYSVG